VPGLRVAQVTIFLCIGLGDLERRRPAALAGGDGPA
jgi:hypothetical protein